MKGKEPMFLQSMEVSTWRQALAHSGKTQAQVNDTTITVSQGYWGKHPGGTVETFITGEVALVMQKHSAPTYYERMTYIKIDENTRDRLAQDILRILKWKEGVEVQDVDLNFHPVDNRLPK